jgi:hypothetical protein
MLGYSARQKEVTRREEMEILYERCAGLDVHKKNVKACLKIPGTDNRPSKEIRTYARHHTKYLGDA